MNRVKTVTNQGKRSSSCCPRKSLDRAISLCNFTKEVRLSGSITLRSFENSTTLILTSSDSDCVYMIPAHFENGKKRGRSKILANVHTMPNKSENCRKFDSKKHLCKTLMSQKCTYTLRIDQSRSESVEVFTLYRFPNVG